MLILEIWSVSWKLRNEVCFEYFPQTFAPMLGIMLSDQCILSKQGGCDTTFTLFRIDERMTNLLSNRSTINSNLIFLFYVLFYYVCLFSKIIIRCKYLHKNWNGRNYFSPKKKNLTFHISYNFLSNSQNYLHYISQFLKLLSLVIIALSCTNLIKRNSHF